MEVFLTPSHLGIVMEYAAGGELFERIVRAGRFSEDEARYFFQQLISGVDYCHASGVCHRDLKLENTLLDGNPAPRLKICDFGYSKSAFDSQPKSTVGTPAYIAPEVLQRKEYNGQPADVWSCGVTLYVMLVGAYPFEDPADPRNFRKTIQRIMNVKYSFPPQLAISPECADLIGRVFTANPAQRITIADIRRHSWFLRNLPAELADPNNFNRSPEPHQSLDEIRALIRAARTLGDTGPKPGGGPGGGGGGHLPLEFNEDDYMDADELASAGVGVGVGGGGMGMHGQGAGSGGGGPGRAGAGGAGSAGGAPQHGGGGGGGGGNGAYLVDNGYSHQHHAAAVAAAAAAHMGSPAGMAGGVPGGHPGQVMGLPMPMAAMQAAAAGGVAHPHMMPPGAAVHMHPHAAAAAAAGHPMAVVGGPEYGAYMMAQHGQHAHAQHMMAAAAAGQRGYAVGPAGGGYAAAGGGPVMYAATGRVGSPPQQQQHMQMQHMQMQQHQGGAMAQGGPGPAPQQSPPQ
ncbi:hypothetical protein HXX76_008507 [Chlamydomonas incerta]|uniref:non-specific serine/threonine protein kinase n=1 Tax=Chlamydomonas incerta TaxID=51695 RepID=A0A835VZB2_CHLIN|nr:hypothetical protein HXX76_008507 [Chlamydomonas incerta]|eukprot:KAG2433450.1 hypothetical protein HXX76_008507 [Chlamydomonas incerta]